MQHENTHSGETLRQATIATPGSVPAPAELLTLDDAARFLGLKKSYLYRLTSAKKIPFFKYGGRLVAFDRAALEAWRAARLQYVPTAAEQAAAAAAYCATNPAK